MSFKRMGLVRNLWLSTLTKVFYELHALCHAHESCMPICFEIRLTESITCSYSGRSFTALILRQME